MNTDANTDVIEYKYGVIVARIRISCFVNSEQIQIT
jgi:hypothetical protein